MDFSIAVFILQDLTKHKNVLGLIPVFSSWMCLGLWYLRGSISLILQADANLRGLSTGTSLFKLMQSALRKNCIACRHLES